MSSKKYVHTKYMVLKCFVSIYMCTDTTQQNTILVKTIKTNMKPNIFVCWNTSDKNIPTNLDFEIYLKNTFIWLPFNGDM